MTISDKFILGQCRCGCGIEIPIQRPNKGTLQVYFGWHKGKGPNNAHWTGGKYVSKQGYIIVYNPNYTCDADRYLLEHRVIMEQYIGRPLTEDEDVHHINGDRQDNRIENLQLLTSSEHSKLHLPERIKHGMRGKKDCSNGGN
jgi:hypothetical protein